MKLHLWMSDGFQAWLNISTSLFIGYGINCQRLKLYLTYQLTMQFFLQTWLLLDGRFIMTGWHRWRFTFLCFMLHTKKYIEVWSWCDIWHILWNESPKTETFLSQFRINIFIVFRLLSPHQMKNLLLLL